MTKASRKGYTVTEQHSDDDSVQTTWRVVRDSDGTGLGAYSTPEGVDATIAQDRATAAQRATTEPKIDLPPHGPLITISQDGPPPAEPDGTRA